MMSNFFTKRKILRSFSAPLILINASGLSNGIRFTFMPKLIIVLFSFRALDLNDLRPPKQPL